MEKTNKKTDLKKPILSINQKIIFSFLLVFIFGLGLGAKASAATKLDVTDQGYIGKRIFATDGTSLYGISSTNTQIYKYSASDYSSVAGYDFGSGAIDRIFSTSVTDRIFIVWKDTSNIYTLYRSTDGGASVTPVCNLGYNSIDGHFANVTVLSRGFLEYDSSTYYFGEYNVNGTRISGSTNDTVRIMKSTDNGVTWTPVVTWNTNGANQVRHVHYVVKDPDIAGEIYIGTGDSAVQTGIIKWDVATGVWSDNKTLTELGSISGFTSLVGAMKYKGLDLLFSGNYIMTFADDSTASESGIWRCTKDLNPANYTSVDTQILSFPNRAGWTGLKTSSGNLIFADQLGTTATDRQINIYSSSDGGNTWTIVGKYGVIAGTVSYLNVMELNGKIYLSEPGGGSAGKGAGGTAIVSEQGAYSEEFPVVLAPVYWVAANGADNTTNGRGWYSNLPWASAKYALLSDKMTYGGRLIIGSGSYNAAAVAQADWNGNAKAGTGITVIEGAGEALTTITRSAGATNSQVFWFDNTTGDVLLKSMWLYTNITGSQELVVDTNGTYTAPATLYMRDMRVGNKDVAGNNATSQLRVARKADIKRCTFEVDPATNSVGLILVLSGKTYAGLNISNSILKYGSPALSIKDIQAGYPPVIYNNVFDGAENFGVWIEANTGAEQPLIKNNIFINTGTNSLKDSASISETGVDYNIYDKALSAVTDGGHSLAIGVDPLFIDAANGNFRLQLSSPAIDHGTSVGLTSDFLGTVVPQGSAPDMGAYEYDATAPTLSGASSIGHTNDTTPNFTFTTDEAGTINYSGDCSSTTTSAVVGSNTITFSALSEGVHSNCLLTITDPAGNESDSLEITTFTIDTTAPDVSNTDENTDDDLNIHNVKAESTENTITITWKTDHNTKSTVKYGISKNLKEKKKDNDKEKKHEVILKNLLPNTKYYFRINATDSDDNEDSSSIHLIMTKAAQISNLSSRQSSSGNTNQTTAENTATPSYSGTSTPNICSYTVESGDTLWSIAKKVYSDATACTLIIDKNKDKYPNIESKLAIGQELTFGCENNQLKNTGNNSNIDNSSQQTQPQPETKTSHWYNPFSWF